MTTPTITSVSYQPSGLSSTQRTERDVQWVVGWLRDLLVIAMSIANLIHVGAGH